MKKHTLLKSKFNSAFSLVELLVVIAVIAVIAAIAIPNIAGIRESAEDSRWISDKATAERRAAEATEATGQAFTIADVVVAPGVVETNRETGTAMTFFVETPFGLDLTNATPPSQRGGGEEE
jgi:prepilin-type N-terminal cleavage/methylation domain-containing protein